MTQNSSNCWNRLGCGSGDYYPYECVLQTNSWTSDFGGTNDYNSTSSSMDDMTFGFDLLITQAQGNTGDNEAAPEAWAKKLLQSAEFVTTTHRPSPTTPGTWLRHIGRIPATNPQPTPALVRRKMVE